MSLPIFSKLHDGQERVLEQNLRLAVPRPWASRLQLRSPFGRRNPLGHMFRISLHPSSWSDGQGGLGVQTHGFKRNLLSFTDVIIRRREPRIGGGNGATAKDDLRRLQGLIPLL